MGVGFGAATSDVGLVRRGLKNLGIAAGLSVLVSALYFHFTLLTDAGSELLARTSPTTWDVAIALFGGAAGAIGLTQREVSNVVPGVSIATALMPPLCTAGYGLATAHWTFLAGALYLFCINAAFISLACFWWRASCRPINVLLMGRMLTLTQLRTVRARLADYRLPRAQLTVRQGRAQLDSADAHTLRTSLLEDMRSRNEQALAGS